MVQYMYIFHMAMSSSGGQHQREKYTIIIHFECTIVDVSYDILVGLSCMDVVLTATETVTQWDHLVRFSVACGVVLAESLCVEAPSTLLLLLLKYSKCESHCYFQKCTCVVSWHLSLRKNP